jgi:exo-1,4-beta-D-glucosaminidase
VRAIASGDRAHVTLANRGEVLAFFVEVRACDHAGQDILPVTWSDNHVTLLPGETLRLEVAWLGRPRPVSDLAFALRGPNVVSRVIAASPAALPLDERPGPARSLPPPRAEALVRGAVSSVEAEP